MVASLKTIAVPHEIFLKFYESDFKDLSFKSLDAELSFWKHHWENCSANLPDNVSVY